MPKDRSIRLQLLGGFSLVIAGTHRLLSGTAQRIVAFVALHRAPVRRDHLAYTLWVDKPEARARANLRSALWRMHLEGVPVPVSVGDTLVMPDDVVTDYELARESVAAIVGGAQRSAATSATALLEGDLLPDWYDDWVIAERERYRQGRLHALEVLSADLVSTGRAGAAIDLALAVLSTEPLRESALKILVYAHLAEGNAAEAWSAYAMYAARLMDELGVAPTPELTAMLGAALSGSPPEQFSSPSAIGTQPTTPIRIGSSAVGDVGLGPVTTAPLRRGSAGGPEADRLSK